LESRVARYRELGAVPYRPTPRGGRAPTDPELIESITSLLSSDAQTPAELAEALEEEPKTVKTILERLVKDGEAFAQGSGKGRRFYVIDEEE
jgi:DNA-binding MarR family transcriptional regulator